MTESQPQPSPDIGQSVAGDPDREMANAAKAARAVIPEIEPSYPTDMTPPTNHSDEVAGAERKFGHEALRSLIHDSKFYVNTSITSSGMNRERMYDNTTTGLQDFGTVPPETLRLFQTGFSTHGGLKLQMGDPSWKIHAKESELEEDFRKHGVTEVLTVITQRSVAYERLAPDSEKKDEPIVTFTYERKGAIRDAVGRPAPLIFTLALPESDAKILEAAVVENPSLIREATNIVMLEELNAGDSWTERMIPPDENSTKLAIRKDFTVGSDASTLVSF